MKIEHRSITSGEIERRTIASQATLEYRDGGKTPVIVGYAAVYNSESRNLGGFVEVLEPRSFDKVLSAKPDVVCVWNHNKDAPLGRINDGRLTLKSDDYGLRYEVTPDIETSVGKDVTIWVKNRTVQASSFAFAVNRDGGEKWEPGPHGLRLRRITEVALLDDVSPVLRPAYDATSVVVSRRALEIALGESFRPNQTMASAAKRGLKAAPRDKNVDPMLVSLAERIAERQIIVTEDVLYLSDVTKRSLEAKNAGWSGTLPWIEWQLAGGDSGEKWIQRRMAEMAETEPRDADLPQNDPENLPESSEMSKRDEALCAAYRDIGTKMGPWDDSDVHYMDEATGTISCREESDDEGATSAMANMENMNSAPSESEARNEPEVPVEEPKVDPEVVAKQREEAAINASIAALDAIVLETYLHGDEPVR